MVFFTQLAEAAATSYCRATNAVFLVLKSALLLTLVPCATVLAAPPDAVDDNILVPSNTTVFANDVAANDTSLATDVYTITTPPSHGTATLTADGLLDYTPNIGFASLDSLTYTVDDGTGGVDTATVTLEVVLTSDFLSPGENFLIGQEDVPTSLNLSVDPSLEYGGTLQDVIGVDALYREENGSGIPVSSTIPAGSTGIKITGYATRNVGTNANDAYNDDYEMLSVSVNLRDGTYSGRLTYSISPHLNKGTIDQYAWIDVPLGQSVLTDTSYVGGLWTGDSDPTVDLVNGQIRITETIPLQIAYHVEYMTSDGDSTDFVGGSGAVQTPGETASNFAIPPELEPTDGSKQGYLVVTGNSAAAGSNFAEEHKGFSRLIVDLEAGKVSGVIASERGELDSLVTAWAFLDYPLIDLRDTPAAVPVAITASTATRVGDDTATGTGVEDDPVIYIDAAGELIVERAADHASAFTTMFTLENYTRTGLSSIASFVGVANDTSLFDSNPPDGVDTNGKPVNLQTFPIPASSSIGIVQMSWQTAGGNGTNENVGYGFAVVDLNDNTSAGSITFSRTTTPDLVAWQSVPLGTTMYGATNGGVPLFQSNKAPGEFTDDYGETARFTVVDNADGSRTLEFTATSNAGTGTFADYVGTTQVSWLGSEPFEVQGVPGNGTLSHGSPADGGGWEVDFADIPLLTISTDEHGTGELRLDLVLSSTGETDSIIIHVEPVVDDPIITATDIIGYVGNPVNLGVSVGDSADVDGSETQLQTLTLSGVPTSVTLSSSAGTVTNFGGGNWQVDSAALASLEATGTDPTTATITVSDTNTDTDDLDGDGVIEDVNNGAGVDELDTFTFQETFELVIREVPTVVSQETNTGTPVISGTAAVGAGETLTVEVNGITYTAGDGNLADNGDGTWDLTIPAANSIADGTYAVSASLSHVSGGTGADITTSELIIDATPPVVPTVISQTTSDATPVLAGTATVAPGETLTVTVNGVTYTAGDGNLADNGDGTWDLSITTPVAEGTYNVTATVTDSAGNSSVDTTAGELIVEATPLSTPTVVALTTSDNTPAITGTAVVGSGETFTVEVNGVTYTAGDGNLVYYSNGNWTLNIPTLMADGTFEVVATVTDVFGNPYADTSSDELIVDTTAPVTPTVISQTTNNTTPVISGTTTVGLGETLSVTVDGVTYTDGDGNLVDNGDGTWDLTVTSPMPEGTYSVTAKVVDAAGNTSVDTTSNELIIDTTVPPAPTVTSQVTSNTTPVVSGTGTLGAGETLNVSVAGITYTAGDGNLVDNGDGTWDLTIPTALADGNYSVTATITDTAGNATDDATSLELTIDTVAPVTPTVASQSTNSTSPLITGTATVAAGDILTVEVDGITYTAGDGYLADNGDGTWALSIPVSLSEGTYDVTTTVTDVAGNATSDTTAGELIIDLTAPIAPGVTSLATTDTTPVIEGTATVQPGETLTVEVDGIVYTAGDGNLVDNGDGTWSLTIPATNILAENLYQVIARVTDAAGNVAIDPGVDDLVVDLTAPETPGVTSLTTNDTTPVIEGTGIINPGETLRLTVNGITYTAGDGNLVDNTDGTWTLSIPTVTPEGLYDVTATITDIVNNTSTDPSSSELLIDTTPPLIPTSTPLITSNTTPVISGTANPGPGETLTVTVNGVTYTVDDGNLLYNGDSTWDLAIPVALPDDTYEVTTSVADAAGNISTDTSANELVIDTTAPVAPTVDTLVTNNPTPVVTGTTSTAPGESLAVSVNGVTYTEGDGNLVVNADGTWDLTIPAANTLTDGTYEVSATITDLAGNTTGDTNAAELIVDTVPPEVPAVVSQNTSNTTPVISGTATVAAGETLTVTVNGITYTAGDGNLVNNGDGTWDLTVPAAFTDNTYPVTVTVIDAAGNSVNDFTTAELIIDTTAPVTPTVVSQITSNNTPTISGTATVGAGETLSVTVNGTTYTTAGSDLVLNPDGSWNLTVPVALFDNTYDVTATVTDTAANATDDTTSQELIVDTTPPPAPTASPLTTNNSTPVISGTASVDVGDTLSVIVNGVTYTSGDGFLVDNGDGTWDLTIATALADGNYSVTATVTDSAGNATDDSTSLELTIDTVPPATPTATALTTNNTSPVISGTAIVATGDTLTVTVDGVTYTAGDGYLVDNGDSTWDLSIPTPLAEAAYDVTVTVTDPAGNATTDTSAGELVIDVTAPLAPGVTSLATTDTTPVIEGTATVLAGEVLTVEVDGVTYTAGDGNLVDNADGTWTLTIPAANLLAENLYQVLATVTDAAGNSASDPGTDDLLVDLTAPVTPGVTSLTTNNTTPVLEGTAVVASGETLSVTVNGTTYIAGDGNLVDNTDGTWTLSIPTTTPEGLYDVTATITDIAGNTSTDPSSGELLIDTTTPVTPTVIPQQTNNTTPVISGTANAGPAETLTVEVDGVTYTAGDGNLVDNADGTWDLTIPTPLAEATYAVTTSVTDAAGNVSTDTSTDELIIDITPPVVPTVDTLITSNTTPVLSGTTSTAPGETLTVTVDGNTYTEGDGNLVVNGDGTWDLTIPSANAMVDGTYDVTAAITDLAGNITNDVTADELIVDTTPPVIPTVISQNTSNTTPVISGTATVTAGETLTVEVNGVTYTAGDGNLTDNGDGTWDLIIPAPLADNTYPVTVTVTDAAGNLSVDTTTSELIIDTVLPVIPAVTSQITNNTTPVISGTATVAPGETLSVTVDGTTYTAGDGNLVDNGNGTWDLSIPASLIESTYAVTANITDAAGNSSDDISNDELVVDLTPPVTPTVTSQTTNIATPVISGTTSTASGEQLSVEVNGITYMAGDGNLVANGDGTWDLTIPAANTLPDSVYDVTATITDQAGNTTTDTTAGELIIDTVPPATPTVTSLYTSITTPVISGTATIASGETLTVTVDGSVFTAGDGNLVDNGDGTWDLTIPAAMTDGNYEVTATVTDAGGNSTDDATALEVTIDTIPPVVPTVVSQTTNNPAPIVSGTATVGTGEALSVTIDGVTYTAGDGYLVDNGDGTWDLSIPTPLAEATYDVTVTVTDPAGNATTDTTAGELIIDVTAPLAPGVTSLATTDTTPIIEGTATVLAGEVLTVEVDGVTYTAGDGNLVDNADGTWTLTIPAADVLAENLYQVLATVTDAAGNSASDPGTDDLLVDLTAPVTPGVTSLTTNNTTPVLEGTAVVAPGETLSVTVNGTTYIAGDGNLVDNTDGTWTLSIPTVTPEGLYDVTATITDIAGNTSTDPSSGELLIDTTTPVTPTVIPQQTNNTTPVISGTANAGPAETLTVEVDGVTYTAGDGNLVDNSDGTWDLTIPTPLAEATYAVTTSVTDAAGNVSTDTSTDELIIDITPPVAPTVDTLITSNTTPVLSGTTSTAPGETLTVTVDGVTYTEGDGNLVVNSDGTWELTIPPANAMVDGTYDVTAAITDLAGNTTNDVTADELIVDTTPPVIPTVISQNTSNTTPVISGTATVTAGETLAVEVNGVTYTAGDGNLTDNGDGTWGLIIPAPLADNTYPVTVTVLDSAGNSSIDTTTTELVVDTVAPAIPTIISQSTNVTTPVITGTATVTTGESLTVEVNGVTYTAGDGNLTDNGNGTWDLTIPTPLAENAYSITATVTDAAGNSGVDTTADELIVDLTPPPAPGVTSQTTADQTPVISGTTTVGSGFTLTVEVNGITYTEGDGNLVNNNDGTWDLAIPVSALLPESTYEVIATLTDAAGNSAADPGTNELVVDITSPGTPGVTSLTTNDTTPVISGTAIVGAGETLTVEVNGINYTAGDGNLVDNGDGSWDLTIPAANALPEAQYDVTATVTDAAGNLSTDPSTGELLIDTTAPVAPTVDFLITNVATPVVSGTATVATGESLNVTVNGTTYSASDGNLIDNGDGTWDLTIPVTDALTDGDYEVIATVTDAAGNFTSDATTGELVVDLTAPLTPVVTSLITNNPTPVISGFATVSAGEVLTVEVNGTTYTAGDGSLVNNSDDTWDLTIPVTNALPETTYDVTATVTDAAGNATSDTTASELIIDTTPPPAPGVTSQTTNNQTPVISGTTTVGTGLTLAVEVNGVTYTEGDGNLVNNNDGTWDLTIPPVAILPEATYEVVATLTDSAGNTSSDPGINDLVVDITAPATPGVTSLTTNDTTPVVSGTAVTNPGDILTVAVNGITYTAGDGNLINNGDSTWDLTIPAANALPEATYDVTAVVTDPASNIATDPSSQELLIDLTAPVAPLVTPQITNTGTPVISGTVTVGAGEILTVTVNGITYTTGNGNLVDNGDGTWDLTIPATNALTDDAYEVTVTVTDAAGNTTSDSSATELVIDLVAPVAPSVTTQTTNTGTPVISGTATVGSGEVLTVEVNGVVYTAGDGNLVDNGDGTWDLAIPAANTLTDATYDVLATVTDTAGNATTDTTAGELIIDLFAPVTPTVVSQTTNITTPVISGTATVGAGEVLTVEVNNLTYTAGGGNLIDNGDGTWDLTIPTADALAEAAYSVTATVTDVAGNVTSDTTAGELIIDTTPPPAPGVTSQTTNNQTPVISGTTAVGTGLTLTVEVNGVTYTEGDGNLANNNDGTWDLTVPPADILPEATYEVTATLTDTAGNASSDPGTNELVVDITAPATPGVTSLTTNDTTPVISGTAATNSGDILTVQVNGITYTAGDGNLTDNGDGTWDLAIPATEALPEATYDVTAVVTDPASNSSTDPSAQELLVDLTAPVAPTVTSQTTNTGTPVISGTANVGAGEVLTVMVNGITYTAGDGNLIDNSDDTWDLTIPPADTLADNAYEVTVTDTDIAANATSDSSATELVIDLVAPAAPTVTALTTNTGTPVISGTAIVGVGEVLTVEVNGIVYTAGGGNLVDNGDGTWSLTIPAADTLTDDNYEVLTTITDAAGNATGDSSASELIVDLIAPVAPAVISQITNITTPVISGTATVGASEVLTVEVNGIAYTAGDGNLIDHGDGTWSLTIPTTNTLPEATYDVTATVTDAAGNTTPDITASELMINTTPPPEPGVTSQTTRDQTPVISGTTTISTGLTLTVEVNGVIYTESDGNLVNNGDGTWDLTIPPADILPEATYEVLATLTDTAGNTASDPGNNELVVDITAPATPGVTSLTTNDTTPVISGTADTNPGDILTVDVNGNTYTAGDGNLLDNGDGTWDLFIPATDALPEATYDVTAVVTDPASNTSTDPSTQELLIDLTAPVAPAVTSQTTNTGTPVISGTATVGSGEILTVEVNGITYTAGDGNLVDNSDGTWDLTIPLTDTLPDDSYEVTVTVTDTAGNATSDSSTAELIIDLIVPVIPVVTAQTTNTGTPVINGTATVGTGEVLTVEVNGITYTAGDGNLVDNGDGTWALTIPASDSLPESAYDVIASVTDAAGNVSTVTTAGELIIDTAPPPAPGVTSQTTNDQTPVISGTVTAGTGLTLTVEVNGITYTEGDGNLINNNDGTWDLFIPVANTIDEGAYDVTATLSDNAGNSATDPAGNELVIDITAPPTPGVTSLVTNDTTPTISGTAIVSATDTLTVEVNGAIYTAGDENLKYHTDGTWTLDVPTGDEIPENTWEVTAIVIDASGNTSTDPSLSELLIDLTAPVTPAANPQVSLINTPVLSGVATLNPGEILTVTFNGVTYTAGDGNLLDNGDGTWTLDIPASQPIADGIYPIQVSVTDLAGNISYNNIGQNLTVDTGLPALTAKTISNIATYRPEFGGTTDQPDGSSVTVTDDNGNVLCTAVVSNGNWSCTSGVDLPEGVNDLLATISELAGNSTTAPFTAEISTDFDGDGIPNNVEGTEDTDGDGIADSVDLDSDNDGIADILESQIDTDNDGVPNYLDPDSDNDGIPDTREVIGKDYDRNFVVDNFTDLNGDGLSDPLQQSALIIPDTDFDGIPDYMDVDSDQDGVPDIIETDGFDSDNDGRIDDFTDLNNDGIDDGVFTIPTLPRDTDKDGIIDYLDKDSDNDGKSDLIESGAEDLDNDSIVDSMKDTDHDAIPDSVDVSFTFGSDDDNDGIDDRFDASILSLSDEDGDGIADNWDPDANGDGYADTIVNGITFARALPDEDNDGIADLLQPTSGQIKTGLQGHGGCVYSGDRGNPVDPALATLLMLSSVAAVRRRRKPATSTPVSR